MVLSVQISARLYAFDASTHSWKERGRGDIRLNDTCQREGLFQSRLGQYLHMYTSLAIQSHIRNRISDVLSCGFYSP